MFSTYKGEDVTVLLKDISGLVQPLSTEERESRIQSGTHYSEMLPIEYTPTERYQNAINSALTLNARRTAEAVATVAEQIWNAKEGEVTLVSLARAGTPIGILIKRYLDSKYHTDVPHYTISIIRGKGIDENALRYILKTCLSEHIQFVDGWTGKGSILKELKKAIRGFPRVSADLAVLSDPAYISTYCGTHKDFLVPSSCLNATVSGLLSRTFLSDDLIGPDDFHGAVYYSELLAEDLTYHFIDTIEKEFPNVAPDSFPSSGGFSRGLEEVREIASMFNISDLNLIKPGIGESIRVLLRRVPWKLLVRSPMSREDDAQLAPLYQLAYEKGVDIIHYPLYNYLVCGLIRPVVEV